MTNRLCWWWTLWKLAQWQYFVFGHLNDRPPKHSEERASSTWNLWLSNRHGLDAGPWVQLLRLGTEFRPIKTVLDGNSVFRGGGGENPHKKRGFFFRLFFTEKLNNEHLFVCLLGLYLCLGSVCLKYSLKRLSYVIQCWLENPLYLDMGYTGKLLAYLPEEVHKMS